MKKMKRMFKNERINAVMLVVCLAFTLAAGSILTSSTAEAATKKVATVKKPAKVKGLKKVKTSCKWNGYHNVSTLKIKYNKVKGAAGYQILIYDIIPDETVKNYGAKLGTPLLYAKTTKKTTYNIQNLLPGTTYKIKVRVYKKGKDGKKIYGKSTTIKAKTSGKMKGSYYTCRTCLAVMPQNAFRLSDHGKSVREVCKELHAGGTLWWTK